MGPGINFEPEPPDKLQPMNGEIDSLNTQRLDCVYDDEPLGFKKDPVIVTKRMQAQNPLEEIELGDGTNKRPTYISVNLDPKLTIKNQTT